MSGVPFSDLYSRCYDLLYREKNYARESAYVLACLQAHHPQAHEVLELGCGTGRHAEYFLQAGFSYTGIDRSQYMVEQARLRCPAGTFLHRQIGEQAFDHRFDAVLALFHVMSYQDTNEAVRLAFRQARQALRPGGLFLFDFWYGPAVLTTGPEPRQKFLEDTAVKVQRDCLPTLLHEQNIVEVRYCLRVTDKITSRCETFEELHRMRYFFLPELLGFAEQCGFSDCRFHSWLSERPLSVDCWSGFAHMRVPLR